MKLPLAILHHAQRFLLSSAFFLSLHGFAAETNSVALTVLGEVEKPLQIRLADLQGMPRTSVKAREKNGPEVTFEGVALAELIQRAQPKLTEKCCGNAANACVVVRGVDNYRVVFSLAEIHPDFTDRRILVADRCEGRLLAESKGPLRLVVPGEKVHARWVRQVCAIEILTVGTSTNTPAR